MGYRIHKLQNASSFPGNPDPTIVIEEGQPGWEEALLAWKSGKSPTDSPEWKKGVFALTTPSIFSAK